MWSGSGRVGPRRPRARPVSRPNPDHPTPQFVNLNIVCVHENNVCIPHLVQKSPLPPLSCDCRTSPASQMRTVQPDCFGCAPRPGAHRALTGSASEKLDCSPGTHFQNLDGAPALKYPSPKTASGSWNWDASPAWLRSDLDRMDALLRWRCRTSLLADWWVRTWRWKSFKSPSEERG